MFSHLDAKNQPAMVDVGDKAVTRRTAHAVAVVTLPGELAALLRFCNRQAAHEGLELRDVGVGHVGGHLRIFVEHRNADAHELGALKRNFVAELFV